MKKFFILLTALCLTVSVCSAQKAAKPKNNILRFGAKFGMNFEEMNFKTNAEGIKDLISNKSTGYYAGIVARVKIPVVPIFIQPEFMYNWGVIKTNNITVPEGEPSITGSIKTQNFSIPVMVGLSFGNARVFNFRIQAGPVFNFATIVDIKGTNLGNLGDAFVKDTIAWSAGIGFDIFNVMLDVKYNGQFKTSEVTWSNSLDQINTKPTSWTASIGILF